MAKALENVKILDFTRMYSGPFCSFILKELGAEVIKVEIPGGGDAVRTLPPQTEGEEGYIFLILNRGKKSITLNLDSEKGQKICKRLVSKVDVVLENFSYGVMDRLGLGYNDLRKIKPDLIYASISGFGHTGPRRNMPAYDIIAQAMSGFMSVTGYRDGPPTKAGPAIADFTSSFYAAIAILAALYHKKESSLGQKIDISMQDAMWAITAIQHLPGFALTGQVPERLGNGSVEVTPFNVYIAKDGYVVITIVTIGQWHQLLHVIGRDDLLNVKEYTNQLERIQHRQEIDVLVTEWTRTRTVQEIEAILGDNHLPCSPVLGLDKVVSDPQILDRNMMIEIEQMISGKIKVPGSVFKMTETPGDPTLTAPFLGQNNFEVFHDMLGMNDKEIEELTT